MNNSWGVWSNQCSLPFRRCCDGRMVGKVPTEIRRACGLIFGVICWSSVSSAGVRWGISFPPKTWIEPFLVSARHARYIYSGYTTQYQNLAHGNLIVTYSIFLSTDIHSTDPKSSKSSDIHRVQTILNITMSMSRSVQWATSIITLLCSPNMTMFAIPAIWRLMSP